MSQLEFNLKANFDQIKEAKLELERLRGELLKTSRATDKSMVQDLTDKYAEQKRKVTELSEAMSRYALVMSSDYAKKMQSLTREVYAFELQADSSKRKIEKLSNEIAKMESKMRRGGLDVGTSAILSDNISSGYASLKDEKARLENLTGLGKQARQELQNMQTEYAKYSGSVSPAKDMTNQMTNAFAQMIAEMKQAPTVGEGISSLFGRLNGDARQLAMSLVGGLGFEQLAEHIFNVRSQFQQLEISFTTMLGSEQKAGALMDELIQTAARTPFNMTDVTEGAKQLLAYGIQANEVNDTLVHLGDIASGLNIPLSQLVYLYGTTISQGRMFTMDLRQFMGRGIPMAETLGQIMGKTVSQVQEAVTKGEVGADLVKEAIVKMSSEGSKFGGLMNKQAETLQGRWSNIEDTIDQAINSIGQKTQGIFGTGLDLISSLIENWETLVKVIGSAAVMVGTYKAGLMAAASIQKVQNAMTMASITEELDSKLGEARDQENNFRSLNGKDTKQYRANRYKALGDAIADTSNIGDDKTEEIVSKQIEMARNEGLITEQMAQQLQTKRDLLVAQQKAADNERMEYENAKRTKEIEEEAARQKRADAEMAAEINAKAAKKAAIDEANNTPLGKAILNTNAIEEKKKQAEASIELAKEEAREQHGIVEEIGAQIKKQEELVAAKKEQVKSSYQDVTDLGGYDDGFGDDLKLRDQAVNQYVDEQQKLNDLKQKSYEASQKAYLADQKVLGMQEDLKGVTQELNQAIEEENRIYGETGASADEINKLVNEGVAAKDSETAAVNANTAAKQGNTSTENANSTARNVNTGATTRQSASNAANTTTENVNSAATGANTTSQNVNTSAKQRNSFVTSMMSVGTKAATLAQSAFSWATNALTTSLRSLWATMVSNPLTSVITLVSTAISVFSMFGDETEDVATKATNMGNKASEASAKVRALFAILGDGKDAESHKDTIDALKSAYEEYGVKLDETIMKSENEASKVQELMKHKEDLIGVIEEQTIAMEHQNAVQQAYESYDSARNDAKADFIKATDGILDSTQAGLASTLFKQSDLDLMTQYQEQLYKLDIGTKEYQSTVAKVKDLKEKMMVTLNNYYSGLGLTDEQTQKLQGSTEHLMWDYEKANETLRDKIATENKAKVSAENASKEVRMLSDSTKENAERNRLAKKSFKEMAVEMDEIRKICERTYHMKIKVDYDDKSLPAWIKNMSQSQRAGSARARLAWLKTHKPGDTTKKFGGTNKDYWTIYNENRGLQYKGEKVESTPTETEAQRKKRLAAEAKKKREAERAATKAEREANQKETMAGNKRKAEEDYSKSVSSYSEKAIQDMTKNRINAMNDGYSKELAQITENADKERKAVEDGIDKLVEARKKRDQAVWVNSGKGRKANMWKQSKTDEEYKNEVLNETMKDSKGNPFKSNGMDMTIGMSVANQMNAIRDKAVKQNEDVLAKEAQSMYDYLKTYGTFQEQKLAIAADYAKRISEVENSTDSDSSKQWKIKSLKEEQKKETDSVEASAIMQKIDWYQVFGNVGGIMKDALVPLLADLDKFVGTEKFQNLGADQQKSIVDAMQNIRNSIGNTSDLGWKDLARDVVAYQDALKNAKIAQEEYTKTETLLIPSIKVLQEQIENAKKSGNVAEQTRLQEELNKVQGQLAESGKKIVTANTKVRTSGQKLAQTTQNVTQPISAIHEFLSNSGISDLETLWDSFDQLKGGIDGLKALKEVKNAADGLKDMGKEAADAAADAGKKAGDALTKGLSQAGFIGQIVSAILKILDVLKDGIGTLISSLIDTVLNAVNGILKNILSGEFITQIGGALVSGIGNILNTISFGGFNSWFGVGGNAKEVNRTIDKLTDRNEILTDAIDKLRDSIDKNSGIKAVEDAKRAENLQKEKEQNLKSIMEAQMGYHGSHHSFNAYFRGFSQEQIKKVSDAIGRQWNGNLNDLQSADEAAAILQNPDVVEAIKNTGKGGYGDRVLEKLKDYAAEAGTLEDIADDLAESLTQISFDSLKSEFIDTLMDMNSSAQDFSDNFSKMLMQAVLKAKVDDLLGNDMQAFYDEWTERAKANGGKLSKTDINALKEKYDEMVQEGLKIRDEVAEITGYKQSYEQSASSGSFESMSQDTGDELNGRFTAVQIATEGTYEETKLINNKLDAIAARDGGTEGSLLTASVNTIMGNVGNIWLAVDEGRTILAQSLMYLQSIDERQERWHKPMLQAFNDIHELKDKMSRL